MAIPTIRAEGLWVAVYRDERGVIRWTERVKNGLLEPGLTDILKASFNLGTQRTWYAGLIASTDFDELSSSDTSASHAGWDEYEGYSGNRKQYETLSVAGGLVYNTSPFQFTFTSNNTVRGMFLATSNAKGSISDIILSTATWATARTVASGGSLTVSYILRLAGGS